jgi:hypothetical protein
MQGFRTLVVLWVSAVLTPYLIKQTGIALSEQQQLQIVAFVMAAVGTGMRAVTSTPMFKRFAKQTEESPK